MWDTFGLLIAKIVLMQPFIHASHTISDLISSDDIRHDITGMVVNMNLVSDDCKMTRRLFLKSKSSNAAKNVTVKRPNKNPYW